MNEMFVFLSLIFQTDADTSNLKHVLPCKFIEHQGKHCAW